MRASPAVWLAYLDDTALGKTAAPGAAWAAGRCGRGRGGSSSGGFLGLLGLFGLDGSGGGRRRAVSQWWRRQCGGAAAGAAVWASSDAGRRQTQQRENRHEHRDRTRTGLCGMGYNPCKVLTVYTILTASYGTVPAGRGGIDGRAAEAAPGFGWPRPPARRAAPRKPRSARAGKSFPLRRRRSADCCRCPPRRRQGPRAPRPPAGIWRLPQTRRRRWPAPWTASPRRSRHVRPIPSTRDCSTHPLKNPLIAPKLPRHAMVTIFYWHDDIRDRKHCRPGGRNQARAGLAQMMTWAKA